MPDETGPVHDVAFEDLDPAVVALHEIQSGEEFLEFRVLVDFLVGLVETVGIAKGVLDLADQVLSPLHVEGLALFLVVVLLKNFEGSLGLNRLRGPWGAGFGLTWC
jgi:hypothetical protein